MKDTHLLRNNSGNNRNGKTYKTIKTDQGQIDIKIPRDRQSSFAPVVIKKYEKTLGPIEDKIISMYAKGMTITSSRRSSSVDGLKGFPNAITS